MIVLTETKLDDLDSIHINNFMLINNNRKFRKKASGGVAVLVHSSISSYVTDLDIQFKDTLWISMSKTFHGKPLVIGVIYNLQRAPHMLTQPYRRNYSGHQKGKTNPQTFVYWEILMPVLQTYQT